MVADPEFGSKSESEPELEPDPELGRTHLPGCRLVGRGVAVAVALLVAGPKEGFECNLWNVGQLPFSK